jgi:drug/metabolite transporter (DMT)-like permease
MVLIWGSTWIAITFQLGDIAPEVSIVYRFALASLMLFIYCKVKGLSLKFNLSQHLRIFLMASLIFCFNYYLLYIGQQHLNSAMAAIAFSTLMIMIIINTRDFFASSISAKIYLGGALGLSGICTLFWPPLSAFE